MNNMLTLNAVVKFIQNFSHYSVVPSAIVTFMENFSIYFINAEFGGLAIINIKH